jgi:WD40 repeat protein
MSDVPTKAAIMHLRRNSPAFITRVIFLLVVSLGWIFTVVSAQDENIPFDFIELNAQDSGGWGGFSWHPHGKTSTVMPTPKNDPLTRPGKIIAAPLHRLSLKTELFDTKFTPDSQQIAVAAGNTIKLYDLNLQLVAEVDGHTGNVTALDWNPDGSQLASAGGIDDGTIQIWNYAHTTDTFTLKTTIETDYRRIINVVWSPDGSRLATIGALDIQTDEEASDVRIWDATTGLLISRSVDAFTDAARDLSWSSNGQSVIGGGQTSCLVERNPCPGKFGGVFIVDAATGVMMNNIELNGSPDTALNSRHDQIVIINFMLLINSAASGELLSYWDDLTVFQAEWNSEGNKLAIETPGEKTDTFEISIFDTTIGAAITSFQLPAALWSMDWSQDGDYIVTGTYENTVELWDVSGLVSLTGTPTITPFKSPTPYFTLTMTALPSLTVTPTKIDD